MTPIHIGAYRLEEANLVVVDEPTLANAEEVGDYIAGVVRNHQRWAGLWYEHIKAVFPETYSQLLDPEEFDEDNLKNWSWVIRSVPPENWHPEVSFSHHQAVASLGHEQQRMILAKAADEHMNLAQIREAVRHVKRRKIAEGHAELAGRYRVAYLTPDYDQVTVQELGEIPLAAHLTSRAVVFMWCPEPLRFDVGDLRQVWGGLTHRRAFIWHTRAHGGADAYLSTRHHHLLLWTRGQCPPDRLTPMLESVVSVEAPAAGGYPDRFRQHIERLYDGPRLWIYGEGQANAGEWTEYDHRLVDYGMGRKHA